MPSPLSLGECSLAVDALPGAGLLILAFSGDYNSEFFLPYNLGNFHQPPQALHLLLLAMSPFLPLQCMGNGLGMGIEQVQLPSKYCPHHPQASPILVIKLSEFTLTPTVPFFPRLISPEPMSYR